MTERKEGGEPCAWWSPPLSRRDLCRDGKATRSCPSLWEEGYYEVICEMFFCAAVSASFSAVCTGVLPAQMAARALSIGTQTPDMKGVFGSATPTFAWSAKPEIAGFEVTEGSLSAARLAGTSPSALDIVTWFDVLV